MSLGGNRVAPDVNFTTVAAKLEGYTGSDIKEVGRPYPPCRQASSPSPAPAPLPPPLHQLPAQKEPPGPLL